jgi:hypothetical protein
VSAPIGTHWGGRRDIEELLDKTRPTKRRRPHWAVMSHLRLLRPRRPDQAREIWNGWLDAFDGDREAALGAILSAAIEAGMVDVGTDQWG